MGVYTIIFVGFMILFKEKPEIPPTPAAAAPMPPLNFMEGFKLMVNNPNFGLLAFIFAMKQGTLTSFGMLVSDILDPFGYSATHLATIGLIMLGGGVVGGIITTIIIDRTKAYVKTIMVLCVGIMFSTYGIIILIKDIDSFPLLICMILNSGFSVGFLPVAL